MHFRTGENLQEFVHQKNQQHLSAIRQLSGCIGWNSH